METWSYGSVERLNDDIAQAEMKYDCMAIGVAEHLKELARTLERADGDSPEVVCKELEYLLNALRGAAFAVEWAKQEKEKAVKKADEQADNT